MKFEAIWLNEAQRLIRVTSMQEIICYNTRLAQWGLASLIRNLCHYCKLMLADSLVFQNPSLR
jgi:hypothetical protein